MRHISLALLGIALTGCATLSSGVRQAISVTSEPPGADARLICDGVRRDAGVTPTTLHMARMRHHCSIWIDKEGYASQTIRLERGVNSAVALNVGVGLARSSWYDFLNRLTDCRNAGGCDGEGDEHSLALLLSWSAIPALVDVTTGAVYQHRPADINVTLRERAAAPER